MSKKPGDNKTALIIEDDLIHMKLVGLWLDQLGFSVITAWHHGEADKILSGGIIKQPLKVDIIICDNNTYAHPGRPESKKYLGTRWIKKIRSGNSVNKHTPIILHTNTRSLEKRKQQAISVGATGFLHKSTPNLEHAFKEAVKQALNA